MLCYIELTDAITLPSVFLSNKSTPWGYFLLRDTKQSVLHNSTQKTNFSISSKTNTHYRPPVCVPETLHFLRNHYLLRYSLPIASNPTLTDLSFSNLFYSTQTTTRRLLRKAYCIFASTKRSTANNFWHQRDKIRTSTLLQCLTHLLLFQYNTHINITENLIHHTHYKLLKSINTHCVTAPKNLSLKTSFHVCFRPTRSVSWQLSVFIKTSKIKHLNSG